MHNLLTISFCCLGGQQEKLNAYLHPEDHPDFICEGVRQRFAPFRSAQGPCVLRVMGLKEKLHLPDVPTVMLYLCCFGSRADGGNEEPPDRRQASVDARQSRSGQGKPECCSASVTRFSFVRLFIAILCGFFFIRLCNLLGFCNHRYYPRSY